MILYVRMLLTAGISLYTIRVLLNTLGVNDFGLYNVVGGVVGLLAFLPGSMASATQRYFSYALGEDNKEKLKKIFTVNCSVYLALAVVALLVLETAGGWFITEYVRIASERFPVALTLYRVSIWTFVVGLLTSPFRAVITAHEDMYLYAGLSTFEVLAKFAAVLALAAAPGDKLAAYGYLLFFVAVVVAGLYLFVCLRRYDECRFRIRYWDVGLLNEVIGFTGWTLFGQLTTVFRNQAVTILINQAFNPVAVAARAIALTVAGQTNVFAANFNTSLYSPIIKSYASGERKEMHELVYHGSKITFFLMWILALPVLLQMPFVLTMWLGTPPPDAILFTRLALIDALVATVSLPLMTAARAPGKMRTYELSLGCIQVAIFLVSWLVLKAGGAAYSVFVISLVASCIMLVVRLLIVRHLTAISLFAFARRVLAPISGVVLSSLLPAMVIILLLPSGLVFSFICLIGSFLLNAAAIYFVGLDPEWRNKIKSRLVSSFKRYAFNA